jgi:hypothetical protein
MTDCLVSMFTRNGRSKLLYLTKFMYLDVLDHVCAVCFALDLHVFPLATMMEEHVLGALAW